jgi:hypothetical protein
MAGVDGKCIPYVDNPGILIENPFSAPLAGLAALRAILLKIFAD